MSFLKRLFGGGPAEPVSNVAATESYEGHLIETTPMKEGDQWRLAARLTKTVDETEREHTLIRADLFPSADGASTAAIAKARQVIDEQGDRLYG